MVVGWHERIESRGSGGCGESQRLAGLSGSGAERRAEIAIGVPLLAIADRVLDAEVNPDADE